MLTRPRVAILCSERAPGLAHLLAKSLEPEAPFEVVCCLTSEDQFADAQLVISRGVPLVHHSARAFYTAQAPGCRLDDLHVRIAYDLQTARSLTRYRPDVIVLAGYLLLLTHPVLKAYPRRIINVHHSDLLLRDADGGPKYPGLRAVRDAILGGEVETRSSAHLVTDLLDEGPVLARSHAFPIPDVARWALDTGQRDVLRSAIWLHQEWMLREAFGPLMVQAIELVAAGVGAHVLECA